MAAWLLILRGMLMRCVINTRACCKVWPFLLTAMLVLVCVAPAAATNYSAAQLQSLLILLDDSGLRIERQLVVQASQLPSPEQEELRRVLRRNAINSSVSGKLLPDTSAEIGLTEYPIANWFSANGELLASTRFNDPRVLRAPQKDSLVHEAIVAQSVARFLLRGPVEAASVEIFLPEFSATVRTLPRSSTGADLAGNPNSGVSEWQGRQVPAANWSSRQLWSFDL